MNQFTSFTIIIHMNIQKSVQEPDLFPLTQPTVKIGSVLSLNQKSERNRTDQSEILEVAATHQKYMEGEKATSSAHSQFSFQNKFQRFRDQSHSTAL